MPDDDAPPSALTAFPPATPSPSHRPCYTRPTGPSLSRPLAFTHLYGSSKKPSPGGRGRGPLRSNGRVRGYAASNFLFCGRDAFSTRAVTPHPPTAPACVAPAGPSLSLRARVPRLGRRRSVNPIALPPAGEDVRGALSRSVHPIATRAEGRRQGRVAGALAMPQPPVASDTALPAPSYQAPHRATAKGRGLARRAPFPPCPPPPAWGAARRGS